jgi:O-acetyl-ADP-ribose deacetylase (regulator of RNase III)
MGGGGVDGAIHAAGGPTILEECREIVALRGPCATGDAVVTGAGELPARHVIHTVGPVWGTVPPETACELLASCYTRSLDLAVAAGDRTVAFPNISTGVYHFPKQLAAETAVAAVLRWLTAHPDRIDRVAFVCFDDENAGIYEALLAED